jgi:hypothetical protein
MRIVSLVFYFLGGLCGEGVGWVEGEEEKGVGVKGCYFIGKE